MADQTNENQEWVPDFSTAKVLDIPNQYATNFVVSMTNDMTVLLQKPVVMSLDAPNGPPGETVLLKTVGTLTLSMQAAKDLAHLLATNIALYESEFGEIQTPWLRSQKQAAPHE